MQKFKLHLAIEHGERKWCGYGCHFDFPTSASYLYRQHIENEHGWIFKYEVDQPPSQPAPMGEDQPSLHLAKSQPSVEMIKEDQPSEKLVGPEESTSTLENGENVENILNNLLPLGCLSPLPSTTPRSPPSKKLKTPSKKAKKLNVTNVSPDLHMSPTSVITSSAKAPCIPLSFTFPMNPQASTEVLDARFNGTVPYRLIPVDVPQNIRPRGRDPRIEGVVLRKVYRP